MYCLFDIVNNKAKVDIINWRPPRKIRLTTQTIEAIK